MLLSAIATAFAGWAHCTASADDNGYNCNDPQAQQEMNYCANKDYEAADAELNTVYARVRKAMRETDAEYDDDLKGAERALVAAQRGWIAYRDGQCELAGFDARGGSMEPMLVSGCLADLTRKRTAELKATIGEDQ